MLADKIYGQRHWEIRTQEDFVKHCREVGCTHKEIASMLRRKKECVMDMDRVWALPDPANRVQLRVRTSKR